MKITESPSKYKALENMPLCEILESINKEDATVALAVNEQLGAIQHFVSTVENKLKQGGRLFYIGAGTSGRLGVLDASECPPTFGVDSDIIIGIIAGGDGALRIAQEGAEDDMNLAWKDLSEYKITLNDIVLGIASSGTTPYVLGGLQACNAAGISTGALVCNPNSPISKIAKHSIEIIVGPEFITGSTRMKAGTAQKMVLNMISTALMIKLGRVKGNKMVDMKLSNQKLKERAQRIVMEECGVSAQKAAELLATYGTVRAVLDKRR